MKSPAGDSFLLHKAIQDNNVEDFESLLCNPDTQINIQNEDGQTPLFVSLKKGPSNSFTMRLIEAGCDVKISDNNSTTPLHLAMMLSANEIAHELIKRGADVNAQAEPKYSRVIVKWIHSVKRTPLHDAVHYNNLEGVCMLLYYGADVIGDGEVTPFKHAAYIGFPDCVKILIDYYDTSYYYTHQTKNNNLKYHQSRSLHLKHEGTVLFVYSFQNSNTDLAKLLWDKINFESILDEQDANYLLEIYIEFSRFATSDWLKYLFLIYQVFLTRQFTITYKRVLKFPFNDSFFEDLLDALRKKNIESRSRLAIIYLSLSLGAPISPEDFREVHEFYGCGEEFEALIYGCGYTLISMRGSRCFIFNALALGDYSHPETDVHLFQTFLAFEWLFRKCSSTMSTRVDYVVTLLGLLSVPAEGKQEIKRLCGHLSLDHQKRISEKLDQIPERPTLVELSRNHVRKLIIQRNLIKYPYPYPYHLHDAIKKLNLPRPIEDLIRFKTSLY